MARSHRLIELTSPELAALAGECKSAGKTLVALLPVGSMEQHGPVLPLGTDTMLAESFCDSLATVWGEARSPLRGIVLPTMCYTNTDSALGFPGTMSVPHEAQRRYGTSVLEAALGLDVDSVVAISGHGPNDSWIIESAFLLNQNTIRHHGGRRPSVLPVSVAGAMRGAYAELELPEGKHADWLELALAYQALGPAFFAGSREALGRHMQASGPAGWSLPGVPLELRVPDGVLGVGWPQGRSIEELAPKAWSIVFRLLRDFTEKGITSSRDLFGPRDRS